MVKGDCSGWLPVSVANALVSVCSPYVLVRMINAQCEFVVVKGIKVGIFEEAAPPILVAAVETGFPEDNAMSEQKREMLKAMAESCGGSELTIEQFLNVTYRLNLALTPQTQLNTIFCF